MVELLVVIAMIGILATIGLSTLNPGAQFQKAQDARRKSDLSQIQKAIEQYYQDNGAYPPNFAPNDYRIKGLDGNVVDWGDSWLPYMGNLPKDPSSSKNYVYYSPSCPPSCPAGQTYYLYASLNRGASGIQTCESADGLKCDKAPTQCGSGYDCNYGISSPNVSP